MWQGMGNILNDLAQTKRGVENYNKGKGGKRGVFEVGLAQGYRRFLQDNCPRQNARVAQRAWTTRGCEMVKIPDRSPDLNPIEKFFHLVHKKLREDTYNQNIERESYDEFVARIKKTIANLISSMPRRLAAVVRHKGHRTMY